METINSLASAASKAVFGESNNTTTNETTPNTTTTTTTAANQEPLTVSDSTSKNTDNMSATNETLGQEPVSGKLGDTSKGEPFDAGNIGTMHWVLMVMSSTREEALLMNPDRVLVWMRSG